MQPAEPISSEEVSISSKQKFSLHVYVADTCMNINFFASVLIERTIIFPFGSEIVFVLFYVQLIVSNGATPLVDAIAYTLADEGGMYLHVMYSMPSYIAWGYSCYHACYVVIRAK